MAYPNYPHEGGLELPANLSSSHIRNGEPVIPVIAPNFEQAAYAPFAKVFPNLKLPTFNIKVSFAKKVPFDGEPYLFLQSPSMEDVLQGTLGDCYLLSTICAILDKDWGPAYIERMMRMSPDGRTVTVRLFDHFTTPEPRTRDAVARYVTVDYSQIVGKFREGKMGARGAPWVHVLEKAFAGFNYGKLFGSDTEAGAFLGIGDGDSPYKAMQALIGTPYETEDLTIRESGGNEWVAMLDTFMRFGIEMGEFRPGPSIMAEFAQWHTQAIVSRWDAFWNPDFFNEKDDQTRRNYTRRIENIIAFLSENACPESLRDWIGMALVRNQVYPGKRGSGIYADWQLQAHARYARLLQEGKIIVAATRGYKFKVVAQKAELFGYPILALDSSTAVPDGKGLLWGHAYTVLRGAPANTELAPPDPALKTLWLRNPWGFMGRVYRAKPQDSSVLKAESAQNHPVFWLELNDLLKRFGRIDYCDPPPLEGAAGAPAAPPVLLP